MLVDVTTLGLGGKQAEAVLDACGITVNKNMIPYDERKPMDPSGIRIGTPALTTRGMGTDEMKRIGGWMLAALKSPDDASLHTRIRGEVFDLCQQFPVPAARAGRGGHRRSVGLRVPVPFSQRATGPIIAPAMNTGPFHFACGMLP